MTPSLSLIVPCFNEASRIARSLATLTEWFGESVEMLVIDDGSVDETSAEAERYAREHPHVRVQRLPENRGKGHAVRAGASLVSGDRIVLVDADLAYDRESIQRAADAVLNADVAIGNRRHAGSHYSVPVRLFGFLYRRHLVGLAFNTCVRTLLPISYRDTQCGLKAFRREALRRIAPHLSIDGFAFDVELLLVIRALGLRVSEIPVRVTYESEQSTVNLLRTSRRVGTDLLRIAARGAAGRYSPARVRASDSIPATRAEYRSPEESGRR